MPVEEGLKIKIGADIIEVTKSINELETEFKELETELKTKTGKAFVDTNKKLEKLRDTINQVKNIGKTGFNDFGQAVDSQGKVIEKATKQISRGTDGAAASLNSLGQVARDLPFGFIAIQNNLPIVADQFSSLVKSSGGAGAALKGLGAALVGPVGISFAIGVVIAGVTALVQKYGSFGAAIDALIKGNDKLYQQQLLINEVTKEANKNAGEEIAKFKTLALTIANTALSLQVRKDAVKEIQEQYGAYLSNLSEEDLLNGKLTQSIENVTKALRAKALAQAATTKAGELSSSVLDILVKEEKLREDIKRLEDRKVTEKGKFRNGQSIEEETQRVINALQRQKDALARERKPLEDQINAILGLGQKATQEAGAGAITSKVPKGPTEAEKKQKELLQERLRAMKLEQDGLDKTGAKYLELARTIAKANAEISLVGETDPAKITAIQQTLSAELNKIQRERLTAQDKARKESLQEDLKDYEKKRQAAEDQAKFLTEEYLDMQKKIARTRAEFELIGVDKAKAAKIRADLEAELDKITGQFRADRFSAGKIDFTSLLDLDTETAVKRLSGLVGTVLKTGFERALETQGKVSGKVQVYPSDKVQSDIANLEETKNKVTEVSNLFGQTLGPAVDAVFAAIESGEDVLGSILGSFKKLILQIGLTIVKAAILAAILSALGLGAPFGAAAGSAGAFGKIFGGLLGFKNAAAPGVGGFATGGVQQPTFGQVRPGTQNIVISGQFIQRGPDMVATINQAQGRINRTG
jgi:hypothetical protein